MNFYQSPIRRHINEHIYKKPIFDVSIGGQDYFGIVKTQRRLGKELNWYMVLGVEGFEGVHSSRDEKNLLEEEMKRLRRDFGHSWGDIFMQLGWMDEMRSGDTKSIKKDDALVEKLVAEKQARDAALLESAKLLPSWREHMPDTTIRIPLAGGIKSIRLGYSKSCKRYINKAKKEDLSYELGEKRTEWEKFWKEWYTMSYDKGFSIISWELFEELMEYLTRSGQGALCLAKKGSKIVSGSVVVRYDHISASGVAEKHLIYLYGATNREFGAIGGHYRLTDQILKRAAHHGGAYYDLLGVAPVGSHGHYLEGVTRFKQARGGQTTVSVGNYDLVFNSLLYRALQVMKTKKFGR